MPYHGVITEESVRQLVMRDNFESKTKSVISGVTVNGETAELLPNTSNIRIRGADADAVIINVENRDVIRQCMHIKHNGALTC